MIQAKDLASTSTDLAKEIHGVDWLGLLEKYGLKLLAAVSIFLIGMWLAKRLSAGLERVLARAHVDSTLSGFLRRVSYAVMLVLVVITALTAIDVPTTSMFAVLGAAGLAVGLALKDSLSNIASGVMLIVLRPFRVGDHVIAAGQEGVVLEVRIFQMRLRAFDQRVIILPNSEVTAAPIINYSSLPTRRIEIAVGVGYNDDLREARELLLKIANEDKRVLADPAPFVQVANLGESSVELKLFAHARNDDFGDAKSSLTEAIRVRLIEHGLSIPYPQRDLHVYHHNADGTPLTEIITRSVADDGDMPAKPAS
jgi:small-conductance mechanosensitive channel